MTEPTSKPLVFVDSNIWLYALIVGQDEEKAKIANRLLADNVTNLVMSSQVVLEVVSNLLKKLRSDESEIIRFITSSYHYFRVVHVDEVVMTQASQLRTRYSLSYWDSLIVAAALESHATILYSEDMQNRLVFNNKLTIINPFS
jgi:predicted nucleic acid-binding protein